MNTYKATFFVLGVLYLGLFIWGTQHTGRVSFVIAGAGLLMCIAGWFIADRYL